MTYIVAQQEGIGKINLLGGSSVVLIQTTVTGTKGSLDESGCVCDFQRSRAREGSEQANGLNH